MKRWEKSLRILLTAVVFGAAAYAFTVIWSPHNIERLFENRRPDSPNAFTGNILSDFRRGPAPIITFEAVRHIVERHVDVDTFPEKSKFVDGLDITHVIELSYQQCNVVRQEDGKFIYEFASNVIIGSRGQRCIRLVTADDGTVITLYPIFEIEGSQQKAA